MDDFPHPAPASLLPAFDAANPLRIGTRGSPLALVQANMIKAELVAAGLPDEAVAIEVIRTSGDRIQDRALAEAGGKGLFTKEIDEAQLEGRVAVAMHSAKDLPTALPDGLVIAGYLHREDVRDAFVSLVSTSLEALPPDAVVGTASLRRQAQVRRVRPDLRVELLRGNVETRLRRLEEGNCDATILALAGLRRLGLERHATSILDDRRFLPAVGQGAVALVIRRDDEAARHWAGRVVHGDTGICVSAERAFLTVLDGSCRTPIAGHATLEHGMLRLTALVLKPDGSEVFEAEEAGHPHAAEALGQAVGERLKAQIPHGFFSA